MTREEAIEYNKNLKMYMKLSDKNQPCKFLEENYIALDMAIKALEQEPKIGHCKDCKWWKDSDGMYRRGSHAESQCPINRREVFEGNGYCYMYKPQESEE